MPSPGVRLLSTAALTAVVMAFAPALGAQDAAELAAPGHVQYVDGSATLERDGQIEPVTVSMPIIAGDRLHTSSGRVEILFADASALDVDQDSTIDMLAPTLLRLTVGRAMLTVAGAADPSGAVRYQIDTPTAAVQTDGPGEFKVSVLRSDETELAVLRGYAALTNERGSLDVRAGERSVAFDGAAPARTQGFNSARFDPFDRWIAERRDERLTASASSRYLPRDLQVYGGVLERSGSWQYDTSYGYVWYPTVGADWRPYYVGYWSSVPSYGWTWIGNDIWSWPTHHYGRWGHARGSWFWIPGRAFGPAWVSWASAADYVSWCPLGYDNRPVFSFSANIGSWFGWTVIPRTSFGYQEYRVNRYAIGGDRLPRSAAFIAHSAPPPVFSRPGVRTNAGGDPRSFGRRDDPSGAVRGPGGRALGAPNAADSSRRTGLGDSRGRVDTNPRSPTADDVARRRADDSGRLGRGRPANVDESARIGRGRSLDRPGDVVESPRPRNSPGVGLPNVIDSTRRRDGGDSPRLRENNEFGRPNTDVSSRRRGQDVPAGSGPARPNAQDSRPGVQDLTARPPTFERGIRQPTPDSYRRPQPDESPRRSFEGRAEQPRFQTAIPRYQPPSSPKPTPNVEGDTGRRWQSGPPSGAPGVIYHRGQEQPQAPPPAVMPRAPEAGSPAGYPSYRRGAEIAPAPPPRSMPAPPAASDGGGGGRDRGGDRGGERAVPRQEGAGGIGAGHSRRR